MSWVHLIFKFIRFHFENLCTNHSGQKKNYMFCFSAFLWFSISHFAFIIWISLFCFLFFFCMMRLRQKHMRLITRFFFSSYIFVCSFCIFFCSLNFFNFFFLVFAFLFTLFAFRFRVNFLLWYFVFTFILCLILFTQDGVYFLHICIFAFCFFFFIFSFFSFTFCFAH